MSFSASDSPYDGQYDVYMKHGNASPAAEVPSPVLQRLYRQDGSEVHLTLEDILAWREGRVRPEVQQLQRFVFPKLRSLVSNFNKAAANEHVHAARTRRRFNGIKTLIDENIRSDVVLPILWDSFGPAFHVSAVNLNGRPDREVYARAIKDGFGLIVTKDKALSCENTDLTGIALRHFRETRHRSRRTRNNFPLIVQFDLSNRGNELMPGLLSRYYKKVGQAVIDRRTPFVRLSTHNGYEQAHEIVHIDQLRPAALLLDSAL